MVEPTHFFFNTETAADNEFMHKLEEDDDKLSNKAIAEHKALQEQIRLAGVEVVVYKQQAEDLPDSLFPNNWISTHKYPGIIDENLV